MYCRIRKNTGTFVSSEDESFVLRLRYRGGKGLTPICTDEHRLKTTVDWRGRKADAFSALRNGNAKKLAGRVCMFPTLPMKPVRIGHPQRQCPAASSCGLRSSLRQSGSRFAAAFYGTTQAVPLSNTDRFA